MELPVIKYTGEDTGKKVTLASTVFAIEPNDHAIYLDIKRIQANKRQGTHQAKERGAVTGSTRKIKKQKGTGTARAGNIKSPLFRGGGRAFGPRPRAYGLKLNKKTKKLARKSVLSYKAQAQNILIIEDFSFEKPKTRYYVEMLHRLALSKQKNLLILSTSNQAVLLASRNIKQAKVIRVDQMNAYDLLHADKLIISESAIARITEILR